MAVTRAGAALAAAPATDTEHPTAAGDEHLVARVQRGDLSAFEVLVRRHNQRLYRAVRSVLRWGDGDVEDVMQDAYLAALRHIDQFEGRAQFGTWLLKIGINEARARLRRPARLVALEDLPPENTVAAGRDIPGAVRTPEQQVESQEMVAIVEAAIDRLPDDYRQVLVLRVVDSLDTPQTAEVLGLTETAVRQRLHRAKEMLQRNLARQAGGAVEAAFGFLGSRCDRMVATVMRRATLPLQALFE